MNFDMSTINLILTNALNDIVRLISQHIPGLLAGLAILVVGWLIALLLAAFVGKIMNQSQLEKALVDSFGDKEASISLPNRARTLTFYLVMLFVLVAFFQQLGLTLITEPLNELLNQIFAFLPRILASTGLLLVAWLIATLAKKLLSTIFEKSNLDKKLTDKSGSKLKLSTSISETVYWLIFLFILPVVLNTLGLTNVLSPVNDMFSKFLGQLPNIFSAVIILMVGWFIARVVQRLTTNLLESIDANGFFGNIGLEKALGDKTNFSEVIGLVVYVFILFPVLISALDALQLNAIVTPATNMLNTIFSAFPMIFAALIMLAIAVFVGKIASTLVENLLSSIGFDKLISLIGIREDKAKTEHTPSHIMGHLTLIGVILFATMEAFNMIGLSAISNLLQQFIIFAGQILMGLVIVIAGIILANIAAKAIRSTITVQTELIASVAKAAILILTAAMGLREMGFASEIVNLTIGIFFGAIGVAIALAFGLGCKEIASKSVKDWIAKL